MANITTQTEGFANFEFVLSLGEGQISVEAIIVAQGATAVYKPGTVMGKVTATGKYAILAPAAVDGTQNAAGILCAACDASVVDQGAVIVARLAEVTDAALTWPVAITTPQRTAAVAALAALNILVRV